MSFALCSSVLATVKAGGLQKSALTWFFVLLDLLEEAQVGEKLLLSQLSLIFAKGGDKTRVHEFRKSRSER